MVCYQTGHYLSFFRRILTKTTGELGVDIDDYILENELKESDWTEFNDNYIENRGTWQQVIERCVEVACYPTIFFFERITVKTMHLKQTTLKLTSNEIKKLYHKAKEAYKDLGNDYFQLPQDEILA